MMPVIVPLLEMNGTLQSRSEDALKWAARTYVVAVDHYTTITCPIWEAAAEE
jgi:hypothetical protein